MTAVCYTTMSVATSVMAIAVVERRHEPGKQLRVHPRLFAHASRSASSARALPSQSRTPPDRPLRRAIRRFRTAASAPRLTRAERRAVLSLPRNSAGRRPRIRSLFGKRLEHADGAQAHAAALREERRDPPCPSALGPPCVAKRIPAMRPPCLGAHRRERANSVAPVSLFESMLGHAIRP